MNTKKVFALVCLFHTAFALAPFDSKFITAADSGHAVLLATFARLIFGFIWWKNTMSL